MTIEFENVWISSKEHLVTFRRIFESASWFQKITTTYKIPEGVPHLSKLGGLCKSPVLLTACGTITLDGNILDFQSTPIPFGGNVRNIEGSLEFQLSTDQIHSISRYDFSSPILQNIDLSFISIGGEEEILLCHGAIGMSNIRKKTDVMFLKLNDWFGENTSD